MKPGSNSEISDPKAHHVKLPLSIWWQNDQSPNPLQVDRKIGGRDYGSKREHTARMMISEDPTCARCQLAYTYPDQYSSYGSAPLPMPEL